MYPELKRPIAHLEGGRERLLILSGVCERPFENDGTSRYERFVPEVLRVLDKVPGGVADALEGGALAILRRVQ